MNTDRTPPGDRPPSPLVAIRSILPSLPPAERRAAEWILRRPADVVRSSIGVLANQAETSEATVVRFCKKAGFAGYPELRLALASDLGRTGAEDRSLGEGFDIGPDDTLDDVVAKVASLDTRAIVDTVDQLDRDQLRRTVEAITSARRIELLGIGASGLVATDLEQKLRRIGFAVAVSTDGHAAMTAAAVANPKDAFIGISHSGETLDVVEPIRLAHERGTTTIAVTNYKTSSLARAADLVLTTAVRDSTFRAGALASRAAQLTVVDCIYMAVAQRNYDATLEALERSSAAVRTRRTHRRRRR